VLAALRREVARRRESKVVAALPERAGPNPAQLPNSASWDNSYTEVSMIGAHCRVMNLTKAYPQLLHLGMCRCLAAVCV
jgi:hypothetical protein